MHTFLVVYLNVIIYFLLNKNYYLLINQYFHNIVNKRYTQLGKYNPFNNFIKYSDGWNWTFI